MGKYLIRRLLIAIPRLSGVGRFALLADLRRCLGFSTTTSSAGLSSRSAMKLGWRKIPSEVNSVKAISATSSGLM